MLFWVFVSKCKALNSFKYHTVKIECTYNRRPAVRLTPRMVREDSWASFPQEDMDRGYLV